MIAVSLGIQIAGDVDSSFTPGRSLGFIGMEVVEVFFGIFTAFVVQKSFFSVYRCLGKGT